MTRIESNVEPERTHLDDHACADLVLRLVPDAEREWALAHAAACPSCAERLRAHVGAAERARAETPGRHTPRPTVLIMPRPPARPWWRERRVVALAAAAVLALAIGVPMLVTRPFQGAADRWLPSAGEGVHTRSMAGSDAHLDAGLAAYAARDLAMADRELSQAQVTGPAEQIRRLYLAQVRFARGDVAGSLALLRGITWTQVPEPWRRAGEELLARALRRHGDTSRADSIDRALRERDPATPFVP